MTDAPSLRPAARFAMNIVHPGAPALRIRYRNGVLIDPYGFPDWVLYARALVGLPDPVPGLGRDEMRIIDVLAANLTMSGEDPLWHGAPSTPAGWCWAHLGRTRRVALVPIELHAAFRHGGGVGTMPVAAPVRGLRGASGGPVGFAGGESLPDGILASVEELLGHRLPDAYRAYLAATNGAAPERPAVLPGFGFLADQPLFGVREDPMQDIVDAPRWLADRFTPDLLPIGYVQGGVLAIGVAPPITGSVWYLDDDDPRDRDGYGPADIRDRLLHRCADSFDDLRERLVPPPERLLAEAELWFLRGDTVVVRDPDAGAALSDRMRAPWQPAPARAHAHDPIVGHFDTEGPTGRADRAGDGMVSR